jgi:hypothetical protein
MTKYPIEIDDELWDLYKGTVPTGERLNDPIRDFVCMRVRESYSADAIESNLQFGERHLNYFLEELHNEDESAEE